MKQPYMAHLSAPELLDQLRAEQRAREITERLGRDIARYYQNKNKQEAVKCQE